MCGDFSATPGRAWEWQRQIEEVKPAITHPVRTTVSWQAQPTQPNPTTQGGGEDEAYLDAEGFLERERRWMEAIFAASRPDDLRCDVTLLLKAACWCDERENK